MFVYVCLQNEQMTELDWFIIPPHKKTDRENYAVGKLRFDACL